MFPPSQPCDPQMLPWLTELPWSCMVLAALCIAFFALHYRSGGSAGALWGAWLRQRGSLRTGEPKGVCHT